MTQQGIFPLEMIGRLCDPVQSVDPRVRYGSGTFRYVDISSVDNELKTITEAREIEVSEAPSRARQLINSQDVLVSTVRPNLNAVALVPSELNGQICSTGFCVLRARRELLDPEYLFGWAQHPEFVERLVRRERGIGYPAVSDGDVKSLSIPLPPLPEQYRIAEVLRRIDELRQLRRQTNGRVKDLLPALFQQMFGNPVANPKGWDVVALSALGDLDRGRSRHRPRDAAFLYGGPYPFIQTGDVTNSEGWITTYSQTYSEDGLAQSRLWPAGTLCITIAANIAETGILTFDACFPDSVVGFIAGPEVVSEYVQQWFQIIQPHLENIAPQLAQKNINLGILRSLTIPKPPIELQRQFRAVADKVRQQVENRSQSTHLLDTLFRALSARSFTGELTAAWREAHQEELEGPTAERDRLLGLRTEEPYTLDPTTGMVVALNREALTRLVAQQMEPAVRQFQEALADNQFVEIAAQLAWLSLAEVVQPLAAEYTEVLSRILSESVADLHQDALAELGQAAGALAESVKASLAEAARESANALSLVLARDVAEMAAQIWATIETPSPQAGRAVLASLDMLTLSLLRAAEGQPAYFQAEDLAQDGIGLVEAEEHLQLLAALGFVRQVEVRGRLLYRTVDPIADRALPEGLEA